MCSRFLSLLVLLLLVSPAALAKAPLRACADPDNLPFSNARGEGFENKLAELVAKSLGRRLEYKWARHTGRGFVRNVLNDGACDLLLGVPAGFKPVLTTAPYYRSAYVFVAPADRRVESFDDPSLRQMKIGVQVVEEEYAPPAIALGRRGLVSNIVGFEAAGSEGRKIMSAVDAGKVNVAVVWGPLAGYYARRYSRLRISAGPHFDAPGLPLSFSIAMGVRKSDPGLRDQVDAVLREHRAEVRRILQSFGVPQLPLAEHGERASQ